MICIFFHSKPLILSNGLQANLIRHKEENQHEAHVAKVLVHTPQNCFYQQKNKNRWSTTDGSKLSDSHKIVTIFSDCHKIVTRWVEVSDSHELSPYCPQVVSSTRLSSIAVVISNIKGGPVKKHPVCMHRVSQNMCMYVCVCIQSSPNHNLSFIRTFCRSSE